MSRQRPLLAIVVPCFNESESIDYAMDRLLDKLRELRDAQRIAPESFLYFIDDGSQDDTWHRIEARHARDPAVKGAALSRNYGHQNALLAGLHGVTGKVDCAISLDADLQQDIGVIPEFLDKYAAGAEIVYGIRKDRDSDSAFKKWTASLFYGLARLLGAGIIRNHADYRLVGSQALEALAAYPETNLFLRGIFTTMGFKTDRVYFDVQPRRAGRSKYNLRRMLSFAIDGITSFSVVPLRLIALLGVVIFLASIFMVGFILFQALVVRQTVPGWASTVLPVYLLGGIQLFCLGVVGEYIGKIYSETKARPRYIKARELT